MKKITVLLLLLLFPLFSKAQQLENDAFTYTHEATLALVPLLQADEALYKNSILYDRVMGLASLRDMNTNVATNGVHFQRAWQELYNARLLPTTKHIPLIDLKQITNHYQKQNTIPVGLINIDFTQFTNTTLEDFENDNVTVTQLVNRNRATSPSPYEDRHLFLASPSTTAAIETATNTPVTFKTDIFVLDQATLPFYNVQVTYNNTTKTIIQNGAFVNANFTYSFATSGLKTLEFKATYTNGKQLISTATINVKVINVLHRSNAPEPIIATEPFKGYDEATDCEGNCFGEGEYQIFFGNDTNNVERTTLQKPIIILDGFDPGDTRKISKENGSIVQLIDNDFKEQNMEKFKAAGFDVVILNFPNYPIRTENKSVFNPTTNQYINISTNIYRDGGADYIERNANVLKALIAELNGKLVANGSTEKLKIIGPSMGGLISRVALTQMEQANQNHNADIWVSFDSPHLGANIPIGLQYFFTFMELGQVEMLKSPAAKQMLLIQNPPPFTVQELANQFGAGSWIYNLLIKEMEKYPGNYSFRNTFKNLLNNLGFPNNTNRNLALINGSINGTRQGTPKGLELDVDLDVLRTPLGSLGRYQIKTFATHDGGRHKIFERYKRVFIFKNTKSVYLVDNSGNGSLDNSPGGTFNMKNEFESALGITLPLTNANAGIAIDNLLKEPNEPSNFGLRLITPIILGAFGTTVYLNLNQGSPAFIPTKSSLAFSGSNKSWHENIGSRDLVCTGETPFDSYFAPEENEPHVTLNSKNMAWLIEEINGNPQEASTYLPTSIRLVATSGGNAVCYDQYTTFSTSLGTSCINKEIIWSVSNNLTIIENNTTSIRVGAKYSSSSGDGWVKAVIGATPLIANVEVGKPITSAMQFNRLESTNFQSNQWNLLGIYYNGALDISRYTWQWQVPSSAIRHTSPNHSYINFSPNVSQSTQIYIRARASNDCGYSNWYGKWFNIIKATNPCKDGSRLPCNDSVIEY